MTFRIGQQVVCVDDGIGRVFLRKDLTLGCIYTIRGFDPDTDDLGIYIEEVMLPIHPVWRTETAFRADRFRPVKETSIEIFTAMLAPTPKQKVRA